MRHLSLLLMILVSKIISGQEFTTLKEIPYSSESQRCTMDIYHPTDTTCRLPVVIWFHGGGLTGGEKAIPSQLKTGEYIVVAAGYRLIPDVTVDDCIDDAAAATAWVIDNISHLGGNAEQIFISGHSAGGYLTSMIGLDKSRLGKYGKDADTLAGLIPFSGQMITHFAHRDKKGLSPLTPTIDESAPLYHVRKDAPPYIMITGDRELELYGRYEENAYMWRMMRLTGHPYVRIYELDGYNHGDMAAPAFHILKHHISEILKSYTPTK